MHQQCTWCDTADDERGYASEEMRREVAVGVRRQCTRCDTADCERGYASDEMRGGSSVVAMDPLSHDDDDDRCGVDLERWQ